jgi:hypothetical protein
MSAGQASGKGASVFGQEIEVTSHHDDWSEYNQDMAVDSMGNIYIAAEYDNMNLPNTIIKIYRSQDGGFNWEYLASLSSTLGDIKYPSIAIGEGTKDRLLVAYIGEYGSSNYFPIVASAPLGTADFTFDVFNVNFDYTYGPPQIWTDSNNIFTWHAYLACRELENGNFWTDVVAWNSDAGCDEWYDRKTVFSGGIHTFWNQPHGAFGTNKNKSFLVAYDMYSNSVAVSVSSNFGSSWSSPQTISYLPGWPEHPVKPQVAPADYSHNVMVCFTTYHNGHDEIGYLYSQDYGGTWTSTFVFPGSGSLDKFAPELIANPWGQSWHLAYTSDNDVWHSTRPQDLSSYWHSPNLVCGKGYASHGDPKKGLGCNRFTDAGYVCWCDTRDSYIFDYDTFFSFSGTLVGNKYKISAGSGGTCRFTLTAGPENAYRTFLVLGSVTGTKPGIPLPGGHATLPLCYDVFTDFVLLYLNSPIFYNFYGKLNNSGSCTTAKLVLPSLDPVFVGVKMYYAYCLNNYFDFASNPITVEVTP